MTFFATKLLTFYHSYSSVETAGNIELKRKAFVAIGITRF